MPVITPEEWKELLLRTMPGRPALQEVSARYIQVCAADVAAQQHVQNPATLTAEWREAAEVFPKAAALYRQAGDSLAALALCGLWPPYGDSVGAHILSLCDRWVDNPAERARVGMQVERIRFAMMEMAQLASDPHRAKPADLTSSARSALEASGWTAASSGGRGSGPSSAGGKSSMAGIGRGAGTASSASGALSGPSVRKPSGFSKPPSGASSGRPPARKAAPKPARKSGSAAPRRG
ncbi:Uncharacterised protein [uncultured archaeon]|nr:Uncharacterised protein [uncultured archaeon]